MTLLEHDACADEFNLAVAMNINLRKELERIAKHNEYKTRTKVWQISFTVVLNVSLEAFQMLTRKAKGREVGVSQLDLVLASTAGV